MDDVFEDIPNGYALVKVTSLSVSCYLLGNGTGQCLEFAGIISALNCNFVERPSHLAIDDRVFGYEQVDNISSHLAGCHSQLRVIPVTQLTRIPYGLSFEEGCMISVAGSMAQRLVSFIKVQYKCSQRLLIHGGDREVGLLAAGLAQMIDSDWYITTLKKRRVDKLNHSLISNQALNLLSTQEHEDIEAYLP